MVFAELSKTAKPMYDLTKLETPVLVELLAKYTAEYTTKLTEKPNRAELIQHEYEISMIQSELNTRKMTPQNTSVSDPPCPNTK